MSDRSFGDHAFRNVVKNPLLSTSVIGLSIEDLTQNAVLLPAVPSQEMSTRRDDNSVAQARSLTHSEHEIANIPSGDTNFNIYPPNTLTNVDLSPPNTQNVTHAVKFDQPPNKNVSKASVKSDDDFDVNEYFARLQGTRYVSAPLNSILKEDQNANLQSSEDNLEEINLNEDKQSQDYQQSITADIAQNFSQLPTVLPQMASVVFNSFSNMLSMKSREQTPDDKGYKPPEPATPAMAVPDIVKDIAPPPLKEPPPVGAANYRITTRKKVYAQIPGLSSGETVQNIPTYSQPMSQAPYFVPDANVTAEQPKPAGFDVPIDDRYKEAQTSFKPTDFSAANVTGNTSRDESYRYDIFSPTETAVVADKQINFSNDSVNPTKAFDNKPGQGTVQSFFSPSVEPTQNLVQNAFAPVNIPAPGTAVIPPPPMFTNQTKIDNQAPVGKSVLPPSVARRISANQPIIKNQTPTVIPQYQNIFVPQNQTEINSELPLIGNNAPPSLPMVQTDKKSLDVGIPAASVISAPKIFSDTSIPNVSVAVSQAEINSVPEIQSNITHHVDNFLQNTTSVLQPAKLPAGNIPPLIPHLQQSSSSTTILPPPIKSMLPPAVQTQQSAKDTGIETSLFNAIPQTKSSVPDIPQSLHSTIQEAPKSSAYDFNATEVNVTPPMFFNPGSVPNQYNNTQISQRSSYLNSNAVPPAPAIAASEPPKASGNINFRMTKKKPSYYSGPIEGVGSISNNIKPILQPVQSTPFQGSFYNPQESGHFTQSSHPSNSDDVQTYGTHSMQQSSSFINYSSGSLNAAQQDPSLGCNTLFDLSRATTDAFEPPQQEVAGFGIIGSLKSKLSSIDIGKIQNTVTTFFDPSYNDAKVCSSNTQESPNYEPFDTSSQSNQTIPKYSEQAASLDMLVIPQSEPAYQANTRVGYDIYQANAHIGHVETFQQNTHSGSVTYQPTTQQPTTQQPTTQIGCETYQHESQPEQHEVKQEHDPNNIHTENQNIVSPIIVDYFKSKGLAVPDFGPDAVDNLTFAEKSALVEAVTGVLNPSSVPATETNNTRKNHEMRPGIMLSFGPEDASDTGETKYPKVITSEPLDEEQQRKLYEEIVNRPADLYHIDDDICVIEPSDCDSPVTVPHSNIVPVSHSNDEVANYFSNIGAMPFYDKLLENNTPSENTMNVSTTDSTRVLKRGDKNPETKAELKEMNARKENVVRNWIDDVECYMNFANREETNSTGNDVESLEFDTVTKKMIENITAPIQLSNPVEVPLTESNVVGNNNPEYSTNQVADMSMQSANELLQNAVVDNTGLPDYEWRADDYITQSTAPKDHNYIDPLAVGFLQNTSTYFDNVLTNVSDELKAECQVSLDDHVLSRQFSVPSAPPAEDDSKSDEGVLDVQLIEQDAKNFMFSQDFVIEPETDDGKIKELEKTSDDHTGDMDSFTHRVEKYKKLEETVSEDNDELTEKHTNKPYPSYFDTGNFAADNHYKNSSQPNFIPHGLHNTPMRIPPGFEQEYYRKCNLSNTNAAHTETVHSEITPEVSEADEKISTRHESEPKIPDTTTQTSISHTVSVSQATMQDTDKSDISETASDKIEALVQQFINREPTYKVHKMHSSFFEKEGTLADLYGMSEEQMTEQFGHLGLDHTNSPVKDRKMTHEETAPAILRRRRYSPIVNDDNGNIDESASNNSNIEASSSNIQNSALSQIQEHSSDNSNINKNLEEEQQTVQQSNSEGPRMHLDLPSTSRDIWTTPGATNVMHGANILQSNNESSPLNTDVMALSGSRNSSSSIAELEQQNPKQRDELEMKSENVRSLPDPVSFFSLESTSTPKTENEDEEQSSFSRLSSYFSAPPAKKEDHSKSFFELSQSQNHYRQNQSIQNTQSPHQPINSLFNTTSILQSEAANNNVTMSPALQNLPLSDYFANMNLVRDLASTKNFTPSNIVTTANYFTVHYDFEDGNNFIGEPNHVNVSDKSTPIINKVNDLPKESIKLGELGETDTNDDMDVINKCNDCCDMTLGKVVKVDINNVNFNNKFKHVMDNNTDTNKSDDTTMELNKEIRKKSGLTVNFDTSSLQEEPNEAVSMMNENRSTSEYSPVKFHWFYRVDVEEKSVWRGFSMGDSNALETAFNSPDLNENTLVATDGGRFDVNVVGRLRTAVYWPDKPTNVRRCSWFYKGTTDARYVPYTEPVAEKLEEEYRHGITTGEWHRRLILPNNEMVVMHGPAVMVHFLQTNNDAFNSSPLFSFGKRVYRNVPKITMSQEQRGKIDHLVLLVHGVGEFRQQREKVQSMMRPRVVRRGCAESEIEDTEPSSIDHLLLLCHGVGSACDMRFRPVEEVVDDFRTTSLQLLQSHYRNSCDNGLVGRIEVLPISWHSSLHSRETGVDSRLAAVTLESIPRLRSFTNDTILDVLFYTSPVYCQHIIDTVCCELNRVYGLFKARNPEFKGGVSLGGHSLGSVILYDLLCHQPGQSPERPSPPEKHYVSGAQAGPAVQYPQLEFVPDALYALGSPIAIFECIRGVDRLGQQFCLPACNNFFNIFHPYDPIAYRIEPMINPDLRDVKPQLIPHHKGRKRMHLELKDTMARVGADIKQKIIESIRSTWSSMWKSEAPPDQHLEKVVEEEIEKDEFEEERKEEVNEPTATPEMLGKLNAGRRIDYVLQEAPFEMINEYLFAMRSHVCYWESEDTMLLILREVYGAAGVRPDCSRPPPTLTVERTTVAAEDTYAVPADSPSTSRDGS